MHKEKPQEAETNKRPPLCFAYEEQQLELASSIVQWHDKLIKTQGYNPPRSIDTTEDARIEKVCSVVYSIFGVHYGVEPHERFEDAYHQISEFAYKLAKDHIFDDGNKRTTVYASFALLYKAEIDLDIKDANSSKNNIVYRWIQDVVTEERTVAELADLLRKNGRVQSH